MLDKTRKASFVENKFLSVIYIFLDAFLKFCVVGLQIVLLNSYDFRGKRYNQSSTVLEGINESSFCFMC